MSSSFSKLFTYITLFIFFIILFIFIPLFSLKSFPDKIPTENPIIQELKGNLLWPAPGYTRITSGFGYRNAPAGGASTYHSGIDIGAPAGSNIISAFSGTVTLTAFKGAGGYTITVVGNNYTASYCHVSPEFIVSVGQFVQKGQIIGKVGPKNVYGVSNNPYKDKNGNPTNGATTGPHLHFTLRKDGTIVNPLDYL